MAKAAKKAPAQQAEPPKETVEMTVAPILGPIYESEDSVAVIGARIQGVIDEFDYFKPNLTAAQLAAVYAPLKEFIDLVDTTMKPLVALREAMKVGIIPEAFEREGLTSITTASGKRVTVSQLVRAAIAGDKEAAFQWLRDNDLSEIVIETVNASTLSSVAKTLIEEGKELDPDLFKTTILPSTSVTTTRK